MENEGEDEAFEEEPEGFDDFTIASSWERFISEIEAACRQWLADGPKNLLKKGAVHLDSLKNLYKVKFERKDVTKSYCMEYYFEITNDGHVGEWNSDLHDLQLSFGVKEFLVIAPLSASGVILDAPEASKLLSTVAIALSNCGSMWPAFVPVHDLSRKAYIGIQNMGTVFTRRFEADCIGSQVPVKLMHLEGLYELFVSKFAFATMDFSTQFVKVGFSMKLTYRTLPYDDDDSDDIERGESEVKESGRNPGRDSHSRTQWDDDCPWTEWYSAEDPVKGFELITIWSNKIVESSLEMAEIENASPHDAEKWLLSPVLSPYLNESNGSTIGFASQLCLLVNALDMSFEAQFMEDFVSVENPGTDNLKSPTVVPPPTVLDRVLKDLFHEGVQHSDYAKGEHKSSRDIKGAPLESLFAQFCLHSLWFGNCNIRAIAALWIEFAREVRWCWEESQPLPRMPTSGVIDLSTCLIHQKLQMLAICINKKRQLNHDYQDDPEVKHHASARTEVEEGDLGGDPTQMWVSMEESDVKHDSPLTQDGPCNLGTNIIGSPVQPENVVVSKAQKPSDATRRGSAGVVGTMMLLNSYQSMHAPYTQDAPLMTEDMHEERLRAVEAFSNSFSFSAQLERDTLSSDMSAFKASNPDAAFEDFIRWHSPGDWEADEHLEGEISRSHSKDRLKGDWPPRGHLSERMSGRGNSWRQIWNDAPSLPACEQKPLLDPNREGEKILHYLETLRPHLLLEQMVCTAFRAAADTLNQTSFGGLKQMMTKMGQFYLTMASFLKPLQANRLPDKGETMDDLKRLCVVFEHFEKLLILAASLNRKFSQAPRLSESFFDDYYNLYLPRLRTSSAGSSERKEFDLKQGVRMNERQAVTNLFTPPSSNQSWRKVLSMGNLLSGHEPILREIIFSKRDSVSGNHYVAHAPSSFDEEIETHRMYICGTSNDLRVALSVTSFD